MNHDLDATLGDGGRLRGSCKLVPKFATLIRDSDVRRRVRLSIFLLVERLGRSEGHTKPDLEPAGRKRHFATAEEPVDTIFIHDEP